MIKSLLLLLVAQMEMFTFSKFRLSNGMKIIKLIWLTLKICVWLRHTLLTSPLSISVNSITQKSSSLQLVFMMSVLCNGSSILRMTIGILISITIHLTRKMSSKRLIPKKSLKTTKKKFSHLETKLLKSC